MMTFSPILMRIGYGLSWQSAVVAAWGGLRGAVGLALALQVYIDHPQIGGKVTNSILMEILGSPHSSFNVRRWTDGQFKSQLDESSLRPGKIVNNKLSVDITQIAEGN